MQVKECFVRNPLDWSIPNDGVAEVFQLEVLQQELRMFVCEGEYEKGLYRILSSYNSNWGQPTQPAVWVSGFYGSGKSHLVKVLRALWENTEFNDGQTALGATDLPADVVAAVKELHTNGKRSGGIIAASGKLQHAVPLRKGILSILFESLGLPKEYQVARFVLWLKKEDVYDQVVDHLKKHNRDPQEEMYELYASPNLAQALIDAFPDGWASDIDNVLERTESQFPPPANQERDISQDEMERTLATLIREDGKTKCTLLVLDELQQYIGDNDDRAYAVQQVVEECSKHFNGIILFVGTGQSAVVDTPKIEKLQGRFTVRVHLSDTDVVKVTRKLVLQKKPEHSSEIKATLDRCSGEIDRHLRDTTIGSRLEDEKDRAIDYPILPVRRRFWAEILRSLDKRAIESQLRTQLRLVLDAVQSVANKEVGTVVTADFIYDQIYPKLLQSAVLTKEINETILNQRTKPANGELRYRLAALIYLIGELPKEFGINATPDTLADLLVEDLTKGSTEFRKAIPEVLDAMAADGDIMKIGDAYHIQSPEGSDWQKEFQSNYSHWFKDDNKIIEYLKSELKNRYGEYMQGVSLLQGESRESRNLEPYFTEGKPKFSGEGVPVWVRDGWTISEKKVRDEAHQEGTSSPLVFIYLPKRNPTQIKRVIAEWRAAQETLDLKGTPAGEEGKNARRAMETRRDQAQSELHSLLVDVFSQALILQGGGNEVVGKSFRNSVETAADRSLTRLFPQFKDADHANWHKVKDRVKAGDGAPLKMIGWESDTHEHVVCKRILSTVGSGKSGAELRRLLRTSPFGWPKDTIDGAIMALVASEHLEARLGKSRVTAAELDHTKIGKAEFRQVNVQFNAADRRSVRKVLQDVGVEFEMNRELKAVPTLLNRLEELIQSAGGDPPLPQRPSLTELEELRLLAGNELGKAIAEQKEQLIANAKAWQSLGEQIESRRPRWELVTALLPYCEALPEYSTLQDSVEAIREGRQLLHDPNPVESVAKTITDALRGVVNQAYDDYRKTFDERITALESDDAWTQLTAEQQRDLMRKENLKPLEKPSLGTGEEIHAALKSVSLNGWATRTHALPTQFENARQAAIKLTEPKVVSVTLPHKTVKSEQDLNNYLKEVRKTVMQHLQNGNPVSL